jgi:tetratricopeptide (TPR) repeat protein
MFEAAVLNDLGNAYLNLPTGDRGENLGRAIECYQEALLVYTPEAWPERARDISRRLGTAHFSARDWPAAHAAFGQARQLTEQFYLDALLPEVREREAGANARMYVQDAFCLVQLDEVSQAWATLETGRARALREGLARARRRCGSGTTGSLARSGRCATRWPALRATLSTVHIPRCASIWPPSWGSDAPWRPNW